jgi:pSer/pThr/pTyr-binding forkhead associated (FHA) protein
MASPPHPREGLRPATPAESRAVFHAERDGLPFLVYRDLDGAQQLLRLPPERATLAIGRNSAADVCLSWDDEVSGLHAQLEQAAGEYALVDDGLSRNGSYVNGERVHGRRRLRDGDMLRFARTVVLFRNPEAAARAVTRAAEKGLTRADLSAQQRKVLVALCRPFRDGIVFATPPTNQQIADEMFLSIGAVKLHLRELFEKFDVGDLPQNKKRLALVGRALQSGLVSKREPE